MKNIFFFNCVENLFVKNFLNEWKTKLIGFVVVDEQEYYYYEFESLECYFVQKKTL